ncbi:hypothetical protein ACFXBB_07300 [Streptomyces scopuliridis]|uniref:hypothetical protein n=1 Tax=Streptomyces scopuliridis TaxID=452529 RepID=UPI00368F0B97
MTPAAARAVIAAHLTDALDVHPHLATLTATELLDRLAIEGWEINTTRQARPVAPRARETRGTRRLVARLFALRVLHVHRLPHEERTSAR